MRSENMAKNALNAVKLPKFEALNGKSWSSGTMVVKDSRQRSRLTSSCARANSCVVCNTPYDDNAVLADNSICLNRSVIKLYSEKANRGQGFQICGKNLPRTHRSRDTAHAKWLQV